MATEVHDTDYEACYGWTPRMVGLIAVGTVFGGIALLPDVALAGRIAFGAFFWGLALVLLVSTLRRRGRTAVRVDARGITLDGPRAIEVPWHDLVVIAAFTGGSMRYLGLQRRPGAPPLAGAPGAATRAVNRMMIPGVPAEVVDTSLPVNGWRLDLRRMAAAVAAHAPHVVVADLTR